MSDHHVYFAVFGFDGDPLEVTLVAGREPDDSWRKGEGFSELMPDAQRTDNRWLLSSGLDASASHRDHFEKLLLKLESLGDRLAALQARYRCGIGVSQYFFMDHPEFYLPAELLARFRQLGVPVSFSQLGLDADPEPSADQPDAT